MNPAQLKIRLALNNINKDEFRFVDCVIGGDECTFVTPIANPAWNKNNLCLRSVIFRKSDFKVINSGFAKFFNYLEAPLISPVPTDITNCTIVEKIDGSLLLVSKHNGELIVRTRGSLNVGSHLTKGEIDFFKLKYSKVFDITEGMTWLYEWTGAHKIVLDYGTEPKLTLIGIVDNCSLTLLSQKTLDIMAEHVKVSRPKYFTTNSFADLIDLLKLAKGIEGYCAYSDNGQTIHKLKSDDYLIRHRFKSNLTFENLLDLWFLYKNPSVEFLLAEIEKLHDYECAVSAKPILEKIYLVVSSVESKILAVIDFCKKLHHLPRKDVAFAILAAYPKGSYYQSVAFSIIDGKPITTDKLKKIILDEQTN